MGLGAYFAWGVFPLYWPLLRPAGALEILAHRIAWSLVFVALLLARARGFGELRTIGARRLLLLALAACLVGSNWGLYIWSVTSGHVVETALGYFINPLVSVMLGVVVLGERMRRAQWVAAGIAAIAVSVLTVAHGRLPWVAISLACSFGTYGLVKKKAGVGAVPSLAVETAVLVEPAVAYLVVRESQGTATFGHVAWHKSALLAASGVMTAVPLLLFAGAANRVPLTTIGLLQYVAPTLQFLCGVVVFHEPMPASRWLGFGLVWLALAIFVVDGVRSHAPVAPGGLRARAP